MQNTPYISSVDAASVLRCVNGVSNLGREIITEAELVNLLFHILQGCESDFAIEQCIAQMPISLHSEIKLKTEAHELKQHPSELFFRSSVLNAKNSIELDERARHIIRVVVRFLINPTENVTCNFDVNDLAQKRWFSVKHFDRIPGLACKRPMCNNDRVQYGVLCPAHHYEMLYGDTPPT